MAGIFISYRRDDSAGYTGRLVDAMKTCFEPQQIFRDIEAIEAGADFVDAIDQAVASCSVLIAVIGPRWLTATDAKGNRRLDDLNDFVRLEVAAALSRDIKVIPILVGGATMPDVSIMPDALKPLARRQAQEITDRRWDYDVRTLFDAVAKMPGVIKRRQPEPATGTPQPTTPAKRGMSWVVKAVFGAIAVIGALMVIGAIEQADQRNNISLSAPPAMPTQTMSRNDAPASVPTNVVPERQLEAAPASLPTQPTFAPGTTMASRGPITLTGNWRTPDGDAFYIEQSGATLAVLAADANSQQEFMGQGAIRGQQVELTLRHLQSGAMVSMLMNVSPDGRRMVGMAREHVTGSSQNLMLTRE